MGASNLCGRSVAVWGESAHDAPPSPDNKLNVHFNYWHITSQKPAQADCLDFFDVGVMAFDCAHLSRIRIYLPLKIDPSSIEDLGPMFANSTVASGIFNESLSATNAERSNHITLQRGSSIYARVYTFTAHTNGFPPGELKITSEGEGTLVDICQRALTGGNGTPVQPEPIYFRLRIRPSEANPHPFSKIIKPPDSFLLSSFDYTEFLDFRLNEARNLPPSVTQLMLEAGPPDLAGASPISRVDYLVVVGDAADVAAGVESHKKRLLESELWESYTKSKSGRSQKLSDGMVIYHWKKVPNNEADKVDDFSAFLKLRIRRSGCSLIFRYLVLVLVIGFIGNFASSLIWAWWERGGTSTETHAISQVAAPCPINSALSCQGGDMPTKVNQESTEKSISSASSKGDTFQ